METSDRRHQELMALQAVRIASQIVVKQIQHQHADFRTPLIGVAREVKDILLVDPDPDGLGAVQAALRLIQGFCGRGAGLGPAGGIAGPRDACFLRRPCSIVIGGATDHAD